MNAFKRAVIEKIHWRDFFIIVLGATIIGPPIGGFILGIGYDVLMLGRALFEMSSTDNRSQPSFEGMRGFLLAPFLFAVTSYLLGAVPAFFSGLLTWIYTIYFRKLPFSAVCVFVFLASYFWARFLFIGDDWDISAESLKMFAVFLALGWISAYCLVRLFGRFLTVAPSDKLRK
jgi:hypothetical protein